MVNIGLSKVDDAVAAKHPVGLLSFIHYFYPLLLEQVINSTGFGYMLWSTVLTSFGSFVLYFYFMETF